jgi:hypothetical protein
LEGEGPYHTKLKFTNGAASSSEKFVVMVDRQETLGAYFTHNVHLKDMTIDGNRDYNAYSSGVQWYGAESNSVENVAVGYCSKRGLIIGGSDSYGTTKCDNVTLNNIWVNGITEGPALSINAWGLSGTNIAAGHCNDTNNIAVPGIHIIKSMNVHIGSLISEDPGSLAVLIHDSYNTHISGASMTYTTADTGAIRTALSITGTFAYDITVGINAYRCNTLINDIGERDGVARSLTIAGSTTDWKSRVYCTDRTFYNATVRGTGIFGAEGSNQDAINIRGSYTGNLTSFSGGFITYHTQDDSQGYRRLFNIGGRAYADTFNGGSALAFHTSPLAPSGSGHQNAVERMRIDRDGSVNIGTATPSTSAILKLSSTNKGFLPPKMTSTEKGAIASPTEGLMVYDTTLHKLCVYNGSAWETVTSAP